MNIILKSILLFLAITGAATLAINYLDIPFGVQNYWDHHGLFFLIFISFFPRLTLIFSSVPFGGLFWWLGLIFAPRILVAFLATTTYWSQNPVLVVMSWLIALSGESGEKYMVRNRIRVVRPVAVNHSSGSSQKNSSQSETIDADFRRL